MKIYLRYHKRVVREDGFNIVAVSPQTVELADDTDVFVLCERLGINAVSKYSSKDWTPFGYFSGRFQVEGPLEDGKFYQIFASQIEDLDEFRSRFESL